MIDKDGSTMIVTFAVYKGDKLLKRNVALRRDLIENLNTSSLGQIMKDYMMQVFSKYDEEVKDE